MAEIDFEKIRKDALEEATQGIVDGPYGDLIRVYAGISSQITKLMLEKYQQQLLEDA